MSFADSYLEKHLTTDLDLPDPDPSLGIILTIPCHREPALINTLESIFRNRKPFCSTEILVGINHSETASAEVIHENETAFQQALKWASSHSDPTLTFHILTLPPFREKDAGVGMARKQLMDEAVRRFNQLKKPEGIIAGLDADTLCRSDYLATIEQFFHRNPHCPGASIYYEHPLSETDGTLREGILRYELHLRYLIQSLRYANFPYAFHTLGSAFTVRAGSYVKAGGMNRRKAGEDFYFLHKIIPLGPYADLTGTTLYPSGRISDRVPFGTGASILRWMKEGEKSLYTYDFRAFEALKDLFSRIEDLYAYFSKHSVSKPIFSPSLESFLEEQSFDSEMERINRNAASFPSFRKGFFAWFNGFRVVKYLNHSHVGHFEKNDIVQEAARLLKAKGITTPNIHPESLLNVFRKLDREG